MSLFYARMGYHRDGRQVRRELPAYDRWKPLSPAAAAVELQGLAVPWWIAGGWATDLLVGRQTRQHGDTYVLVLRRDQLAVQRHLADRGWEIHAAYPPPPRMLRPWPVGEFLRPGTHDIWCRRGTDQPWALQVMLAEDDGDDWVFRRNPAIRGRIAELGLRDVAGLPFLCPEVQLLYKAGSDCSEGKTAHDFAVALPRMTQPQRAKLLGYLVQVYPDGHAWIEALSQRRRDRREFVPPATGVAPAAAGYRLVATACGEVAIVWAEGADRPRVKRIILSRPQLSAAATLSAWLPRLQPATCPTIDDLAARVVAFLAGGVVAFPLDDVDLDLCTPFQRRVLLAEYEVPRGRVTTYQRLAAHLGVPTGARAVGTALATNPFPLVIPCHRAVRADGALGGYQGGLAMKRVLLEREGLQFDGRGRVAEMDGACWSAWRKPK